MVLVLVVGDVHVPQRAGSIPGVFRDLFTAGQLSHVFVTGNVGSKAVYEYLCTLAPHVHCTRGEYDTADDSVVSLPQPQRTVCVCVEGVRIGMLHASAMVPRGHVAALAAQRRELDVDVLLTSSIDGKSRAPCRDGAHKHGTDTRDAQTTTAAARATTQAAEVVVVDDDVDEQHGGGGLLVACGSLTGACTATSCAVTPSFALLDVRDKAVTVYLYEYDDSNDDNKDGSGDTLAATASTLADARRDGDADAHASSSPRGLRIRTHEWTVPATAPH